MPLFYVVRYPVAATAGQARVLPKVVTEALNKAAADVAAFSLNEAEGRSADGPIRWRYDLVEAAASA